MRIPSNLRDDTLYGRRPTRLGADGGLRKLTRLIVALALVVVVMRQAGRQEIYQPFFGDAASSQPGAVNGDPNAGPDPEVGIDGWTRQGVASDQPEPTADEPFDTTPTGPESKLVDEVDPKDLSSVADGSPWRGGDFQAFYRFLELARGADGAAEPQQAPSPLVGVLPLLQQPEVYQGKRLRIRGRVARVVSRQATENEYGIENYWELWIRPHDGTERPMLAILPDVPLAFQEMAGTALVSEGPLVAVEGRFLKRLAYRSASGVELAPVVIGRVIESPVAKTPTAEAPAAERLRWSFEFATLMILAVLGGIGIAALAVWRTSVDSARLRRLRHRERETDAGWLRDREGRD